MANFEDFLGEVLCLGGMNPLCLMSGCNREPEPEPKKVPFSPKDMVLIPAGKFQMGSNSGDGDERPVHEVTLSSYYLDQSEVTNEFYTLITGKSPSPEGFDGPNQPVVRVTWYDADKFCKAVGKRLPTEAEWENAASVGGKYLFGSKSGTEKKLEAESCFNKPRTCDVKEYPPNEFGLYGMAGNVWEWTADWYGDYSKDPVKDPTGPESGWFKVLRGGSWCSYFSDNLRAAFRYGFNPVLSNHDVGFRCAQDSSK